MIMLAVILSGIAAMALSGNYLYFGHPALSSSGAILIPETLLLGVIGGLAGGVFARLLAFPKVINLPAEPWKRALYCGILCSAFALASGGATAGSGYEITRKFLESSSLDNWPLLLAVEKFFTTVFSYLSGMAGGIFSPCLSIGAALGFTLAKICHFANFKVCALIGMVGFFSGVTQAPSHRCYHHHGDDRRAHPDHPFPGRGFSRPHHREGLHARPPVPVFGGPEPEGLNPPHLPLSPFLHRESISCILTAVEKGPEPGGLP
jgi:hypothetical protein